jgi:hypothetical protein
VWLFWSWAGGSMKHGHLIIERMFDLLWLPPILP